MIKKGSVTLVDVAREAGVSLKTASRALNESPEIRPATAARVQAAMARLRYQPNELARGLKAKRSAAIGMIVPNLADPFSAAAVQAVQGVARENGYIVMLASSGGDLAVENSELELMARRQIEGLILVAADSARSSVKRLLANDVPVVVFDEPIRGEDVDAITVTNRKGAQQATEHLLWHRYRRILAVGARPYLYTCAERVAGYRKAVRHAEAEPVELLVRNENDLTPELLSRHLSASKAQAIFSLNWVCTMLVLRGLQALDKRVGEDIALISFDDFELADMIPPGLTVVRQPTRELGDCAARVLFERMLGKASKKSAPQKTTLDTEFIIRGSCGCAAHALPRSSRTSAVPVSQ